MDTDKLVMLCPRETVSLDASGFVEPDATDFTFAEDAVEEMVVCLAGIESAWAAGEFGRLRGMLGATIALAEKAGLPDVARVALHAKELTGRADDVAMAAVVSRLVRVGEVSLAQLLDIAYRQR
jgi:hypothetical protein